MTLLKPVPHTEKFAAFLLLLSLSLAQPLPGFLHSHLSLHSTVQTSLMFSSKRTQLQSIKNPKPTKQHPQPAHLKKTPTTRNPPKNPRSTSNTVALS